MQDPRGMIRSVISSASPYLLQSAYDALAGAFSASVWGNYR